jgi:hypothetical protein
LGYIEKLNCTLTLELMEDRTIYGGGHVGRGMNRKDEGIGKMVSYT